MGPLSTEKGVCVLEIITVYINIYSFSMYLVRVKEC